jgi:hypothetical protein
MGAAFVRPGEARVRHPRIGILLLAALPAAVRTGQAQVREAAGAPRARALLAYGSVLDRYGHPTPGATVTITGLDTSPDVPAGERVRVGWQCLGARPVSARAVAGEDGRFRAVLELGDPPRELACLAIRVVPPPNTGLDSMELSMDSLAAGALAAAGDSVLMDIILPAREAAAPPRVEPPVFADADAELRWLAQNVPGGFGGYWRARGTTEVQVYLVDMTRAAQAKAFMVRYFQVRPPTGGAPSDILFMRAGWDAATLLDWRDRLRRLGPAGGVRAAELRPDWNRVQVTVAGTAGLARLRARLRALAIPERALLLVGGR